jgi:FkbM family methyltransferase
MLRSIGDEIARRGGIEGTWLDVGAHHGEKTLVYAIQNPGLKVYAFEPNLSAAAKLIGRAPNFFMTPMAVAEKDGFAEFHLNAYEGASSLLPFNEVALQSWIGGEVLKVKSVVNVPTIRLETFMSATGIQRVDYLKIDTQGMDLAVVKSAGSRLRDIAKISLEVDVTAVRVYAGSPSKDEVITFLNEAGFALVDVEKQTYDQEENLTFVRRKNAT